MSDPSPASGSDPAHEHYVLGVCLVLAGGVCLSLSGIILRNIDHAGSWQIIFYRSIGFLLTVFTFVAVRHGRHTLRAFVNTGRTGLVVALSLGLGSICYVLAMLLTTVANVVFIISASPFFVAVIGWLVLREPVSRVTWIAMSAALTGIALMLAEGFASGRLLGSVIAFGTVTSFVIMLIALRRARSVDMVPAIALAGVIAGAVSGIMLEDFAVSAHDLALCLLMGGVQFGGGFILITLGSRHVPAAQIALLSLSETVLAPIWVWLGVAEVPSPLTLTGGAIVLCALVTQSVLGIRGHAERATSVSPSTRAD